MHCKTEDTSTRYLEGFPDSQYYLYPFTYDGDEDKVNLSKQLIDQFYSYYEFYRNSGISIFIMSFIFPFYLIKIQQLSFEAAALIAGLILTASFLLFYSSIETIFKYRTARLYSIEAILRKKQGCKEDQVKGPVTKTTASNTSEKETVNANVKTKTIKTLTEEKTT